MKGQFWRRLINFQLNCLFSKNEFPRTFKRNLLIYSFMWIHDIIKYKIILNNYNKTDDISQITFPIIKYFNFNFLRHSFTYYCVIIINSNYYYYLTPATDLANSPLLLVIFIYKIGVTESLQTLDSLNRYSQLI